MRAARVNRLGGPITVEEIDSPEPGPGEVIVSVAAAAVNFADLLVCRGEYQMQADPPFTPGSEFAGHVRSVGAGVTDVLVGDPVLGATLVGAFAQEVRVATAQLSAVPPGVDLADAAAFSVAYGTAFPALRGVAEVEPNEWVVVLGAAGGVGLAAVESASYMGARVIACASSEEKLAACRGAGATETIDYQREDLKTRIRELTGGGADVVLDPVGGVYSEPAYRALRYGGRFVVLGFASGEIPRLPLNLVLLKGADVRGFEIWSFSQQRPAQMQAARTEMLAALAAGHLDAHVCAQYPLDDTASALAEVAERRARGKVLIVP